MRRCRLDWAEVFQVEPNDRTRGSGNKLKHREFQLNIRKSFYAVRMVKHCHRLPREVVGSASLVVLKSHLDMSWAVSWTCSCLSRRAGPGDLQRSLGCFAVLSFCAANVLFLLRNSSERHCLRDMKYEGSAHPEEAGAALMPVLSGTDCD